MKPPKLLASSASEIFYPPWTQHLYVLPETLEACFEACFEALQQRQIWWCLMKCRTILWPSQLEHTQLHPVLGRLVQHLLTILSSCFAFFQVMQLFRRPYKATISSTYIAMNRFDVQHSPACAGGYFIFILFISLVRSQDSHWSSQDGEVHQATAVCSSHCQRWTAFKARWLHRHFDFWWSRYRCAWRRC